MKFKAFISGVMLIAILIGTNGCVYFQLQTSPTTIVVETPTPIDSSYVPPALQPDSLIPLIPDFVSLVADVRSSVVAIDVKIASFDILSGTVPQEGSGSGWIIDSSGLIVTNNHIVESATTINVTLDDGHSFLASIVRTDPVSDLAVIKIHANGLTPLKIGDSERLRVGEWVLAMGNSLGQGLSATKGIVSNLDVTLQVGLNQTLYNLIQTDAAINPGNSGGPLFNLAGEVVGITSVKVAQIGIEGTGYAISMAEALPIITELIKFGYYSRPWMGASLYSVDQIVVARYRLSVNEGVLITRVVADSPAERAGLKAGDVITAIDGKNIAYTQELNQIIHGYTIGQSVTLEYFRGQEMNTVSLVLTASPPN